MGRHLFNADNEEEQQNIVKLFLQAWSWGANDTEAAAHATLYNINKRVISKMTVSNFLKEHPDVALQKQALIENEILRAKKSVSDKLVDDGHLALQLLKCKRPDEYGTRRGFSGSIETDRGRIEFVFDDGIDNKDEIKQIEDGTDKTPKD